MWDPDFKMVKILNKHFSKEDAEIASKHTVITSNHEEI